MKQIEIDGYEFAKNPLTDLSQTSRKPGRPLKISDEMLQRARAELLFALEHRWALIGWELQQAETPAGIRAALQRIEGINCGNLEAFCVEFRRKMTFHQLQAARKRSQTLAGKLREAHFNWKKCKESAELAQSALSNTLDTKIRGELRTMGEKVNSKFETATATLRELQNHLVEIRDEIAQGEAAFAQSELLDFIQCGRYVLTPLNFANAMAGLPKIHWRQSMDRCLKLRDNAMHGLTYKRFQIVEEVFKHPTACAEEAIECMKTRLLQAKGQDVKPLNALAENWYFLRCAIESVFNDEHQPIESITYRIFAEYQQRSECQMSVDALMASGEIVTTPAYLKERRRIATPG